MSVAFVFPGQGSQFVGMGKELADNFASARQVFEEVDEALGRSLSKIIFEGPVEELTLTQNTQPALMAVSMAVLAIMKEQGLSLAEKVSYLAGHSLGEYSALCAGQTFSLSDTARLLAIRGEAMQQAVPVGVGAMAALIGLEEQQVQEICQKAAQKGICEIANDNGAGQLVISGNKEAVEYAVMLATEAGAKRALLLPVSAPFHCSMMAPAAQIMHDALSKIEMKPPIIPIIANVSVMPVQQTDLIAKLLVDQVTGRVRWRETIDWFSAHGITEIYEIGAGKVLTGLVKRINSAIKTYNIMSPADTELALKALKL